MYRCVHRVQSSPAPGTVFVVVLRAVAGDDVTTTRFAYGPEMRPRLAAPLLVMLMAALACSSGSGGDASIPPPVVTVEDVPQNVLAFRLEVATDAPAEISVRATSEDGHVVVVPSSQPADTNTEVPLVGLRSKSSYSVEVTATTADGTRTSAPVQRVETGEIPDDLPRIEAVVSELARMSPGITLFNVIRPFDPPPEEVAPGEEPDLGLVLAVDEVGEIVWYYRTTHPVGDVEPVPGGLLIEVNDTMARKVDLLGRTTAELAGTIIVDEFPIDQYGRRVASDDAIPVNIDSFHHEVSRLPSGNLLTLSTELRNTSGFDAPRCGEGPADFSGSYPLISDVVVEVTPDGDVVDEWPVYDVLDPRTDPARPQPLCPSPFPAAVPTWMYAPEGGVDWSHGNAVALDEKRNALIVSLRHLNAVLAIRYSDDAEGPAGELLWRLGPDGGMDLLEGDWHYYQHAPEVQDDGSILLYDNGNTRPGTVERPAPGDVPAFSRAVLYGVDDADRTVRQRWEHRSEVDGEPAYAFFLGDVDRLSNGNVLVTDGGLAGRPDGVSAQLSEVVPKGSSGGDIVSQIRLFDGHHVYRAERVQSLYSSTQE